MDLMFIRIRTRVGKNRDPDNMKSSFGFEEATDNMPDFVATQ